jgi:hypothetical protein
MENTPSSMENTPSSMENTKSQLLPHIMSSSKKSYAPALYLDSVRKGDKVMGKKVRSIDREDIGKVENVNTDSIEVKDGLIAKRYYIPKHSIQGFEGDDNLITTVTKKISTTNSQLIIL